MARLGLLAAAFLLSGSVGALAADFSGTWEVGVREFGASNFYLPVQDGRLVLEAQGDTYTGRLAQLTFTGHAEKDGLHLACNDQGRACGNLVLQLSGNQLSGKGEMIANSPPITLPVTLQGKRPAPRSRIRRRRMILSRKAMTSAISIPAQPEAGAAHLSGRYGQDPHPGQPGA